MEKQENWLPPFMSRREECALSRREKLRIEGRQFSSKRIFSLYMHAYLYATRIGIRWYIPSCVTRILNTTSSYHISSSVMFNTCGLPLLMKAGYVPRRNHYRDYAKGERVIVLTIHWNLKRLVTKSNLVIQSRTLRIWFCYTFPTFIKVFAF